MQDIRQEIIEMIKNRLSNEGKKLEEIDDETFEKMYKEIKKEIELKSHTQKTISQIQERRIHKQSYDTFQQVAREKITGESYKPNLRNIKENLENSESVGKKL